MATQNIKVMHTVDWFLVGVIILCVVALVMLETIKTAQAQTCYGNCAVIPEPMVTQDPVLVIRKLNTYNQRYYAAQEAERTHYQSYGYEVAIPLYNAGSLSAAATVRGEYDLELQRRSLCAGFVSQGSQGVYAGRALDCRRGVFD